MQNEELAQKLIGILTEQAKKIASAESCTGGMIAQNLTAVPGSSNVFECGIIAYANRIKEKILGVSGKTLARYGAVSKETAIEMAKGVLRVADADIGVSTTGIAGPSGGTEEKPVGTVHIAVCTKEKCLHEKLLLGEKCGYDRDAIRKAATAEVLKLAFELAQNKE